MGGSVPSFENWGRLRVSFRGKRADQSRISSTNRGFILTSNRSPQQSDRRFPRYTVLRWCVIEAGLRQSTLTKFVGRVDGSESDHSWCWQLAQIGD